MTIGKEKILKCPICERWMADSPHVHSFKKIKPEPKKIIFFTRSRHRKPKYKDPWESSDGIAYR